MATLSHSAENSEAAFGCEHLAAILTQDDSTEGQYKDRFVKIHRELAPKPKQYAYLIKQMSSTAVSSVSLLRPKYICLTCSETLLAGERESHSQRTGHQFYMDARTRALYCHHCGDFVYDHGLDRLRSTTSQTAFKFAAKRRFVEDSDDEDYVRTNTNRRSCGRHGIRGMFNLGQTCYMNVILQSMLHDPVLNAFFLGNGHPIHECPTGLPECVLCGITETFAEYNSGEKADGVAAANLLHGTWKANQLLAGYHQQDAHEFYQFVVNKLHELLESTNDSAEHHSKGCHCFFHKAFYGKLRSSVTCDKCGNITRTEDPMLDLSLDIQIQAKKRAMGGLATSSTSTLKGCLESFTAAEKLMAGVYNCSACGPQKATKQLRIKKLPAILCMQLKRFGHNDSVSEKVEGRIEFPLSINMLPFTTDPDSKGIDTSLYMYDLTSAVVHKGKLDAGHYYVYCRRGDQWLLCNDDQVTVATEGAVLNADAYLLFYSLRHLSAEIV